MDYKKIKPKKIYEEVAETIYEMIRYGQLNQDKSLIRFNNWLKTFRLGGQRLEKHLRL